MNVYIQIYTDSLNESLLTHLRWFSWCGRDGIHIFDGAVHTHAHTYKWTHMDTKSVSHTQSVCACVHADCPCVCTLTHMFTLIHTSQQESRWKATSHTWTSHVPNIAWHTSCHTVLLQSEGGFPPFFWQKIAPRQNTYECLYGKLIKTPCHRCVSISVRREKGRVPFSLLEDKQGTFPF